jgi:hypothetical protein
MDFEANSTISGGVVSISIPLDTSESDESLFIKAESKSANFI